MAEPTSRREVYRVIDGERNYQEWRWPGHKHSATEFLVYIDHYVKQGMLLVSTQNGERVARWANFARLPPWPWLRWSKTAPSSERNGRAGR